MDDPLLSIKIAEESSRRPGRELSPSYLDLGQSLRQSTSHLVTNDVIIPIITTPKTSSFVNLIAGLSKKKTRLPYRSHSAPSLFTDARDTFADSFDPRPGPKSVPLIVRQAFVGVVLYILVVVLVFLVSGSFRGTTTFKPVDALYFTVVTLCTIGYGDIVPDTTFTKLFTCGFILVGFGFIDILLNGLVTYICDRQEAFLLSTMDGSAPNPMVQAYMIDKAKGRMRIRTKVVLASAVVIVCIAVGTITVHYLEKLDWVDSFYLAVTSVTTVGYGDFAFTTITGRCFAVIWLLVSTLAVARAFLYLTELRIDRRNRRIAKWVLQKKMTLGDLVAADLDNDGSIRPSRFCLANRQGLRLSGLKGRKMIREAIHNKQTGIKTEVQFPAGIKVVNWIHKQELFFLQTRMYNFFSCSNVNLSVDYICCWRKYNCTCKNCRMLIALVNRRAATVSERSIIIPSF